MVDSVEHAAGAAGLVSGGFLRISVSGESD
jgi:hypothetical protein